MKRLFFAFVVLFSIFGATATGFANADTEKAKAWEFFETMVPEKMDSALFESHAPITRGEVAIVLAELSNGGNPGGNISFKDVPENHPYYEAIMHAANSKIMTGYEDQTFRPDATLTRAQMAKIFALHFQLPGTSEELPFEDVPADAWYYPYVNNLYSSKLTKGTSAQNFSPNEPISRSQFALLLYRLQAPSLLLADYAVIAGSNSYGHLDGQAHDAKFRSPQHIAKVHQSYYISDTENHMIRMLSNQQVSTYTGDAYFVGGESSPLSVLLDGNIDEALFQSPMTIVSRDDGALFIADSANHVIRKIASDGNVTTYAGSGNPGIKDGKGEQAEFYYPYGLALAQDGTLFVSDTLNHTIRKITSDGEVSTLTNNELRVIEMADGYIEVAGGYQNGKISEALFNEPTSLLLDAKGNLFVSDSGNHVIRYIDLEANTVSTFAGQFAENGIYGIHGHRDGKAEQAQFYYPRGLALNEKGQLFVADSLNNAIRLIENGEVSTLSVNNQLPTDLLIDQGQLIVVQSGSGEIGKYTMR
ncbi:S-layer homology domain-containing protein [Solibacillus silvestris]|uniref:S-layer homology domain-containing protein n=1 Tax=Solibacillus silvestris TaxID=76853 RepID=UPI003F814244